MPDAENPHLFYHQARNAVILAAGFGMRMVPINITSNKAFFEVEGETLIERIIHQLHEAGIREIHIVTGFMKESFAFLQEKYGVHLIENREYAAYNNLHSLHCAAHLLSDSYIIPADIRCRENPFLTDTQDSWYMVSDSEDPQSDVMVNAENELIRIPDKTAGNAMIGICRLNEKDSLIVRNRIEELCADPEYDDAYWEAALYDGGKMIVPARVIHSGDVVEINTYEQLRELDSSSPQLESEAMHAIASALHCTEEDIVDISVLKKGMTNRSFLFRVHGQKYIMRIPGEGTDMLIDRQKEAAVYKAISGRGLCDDPVYIDPASGFKITKFLEGVRNADSTCEKDLQKCMRKLKQFHTMKLTVPHTFDLFGEIEFYESLWNGKPSIYRSYAQTKQNVLKLKKKKKKRVHETCLTHIDAVPDNFLFYTGENGKEQLQLTDWEYAGMQDPHVDIAMFCIYSMYGKEECDHLIDLYFEECCPADTRTKIYAYIAVCGLLWSNWCEYKHHLGVEFGAYSLAQYRYAREYSRYAAEDWGI